MIFIALLILAATGLASVAGFFSVYGLSQIYSASALSVIIMGGALEFSKLMTASFLYRHWSKLKFALRSYLIIAVGILMLITSVGIFGYLTAAYQKNNLPLDQISIQLKNDKQQLNQALARKAQIDKQIAQLPNNYVTARKRLINSFKDEYTGLTSKINKMNTEIPKLEKQESETKASIGPIMYVAKALNQKPNNAIVYLTLLLMAVFDPLAVALTVSVNIALFHRKTKNETEQSPPKQKTNEQPQKSYQKENEMYKDIKDQSNILP